jgi:hypothetical protein
MKTVAAKFAKLSPRALACYEKAAMTMRAGRARLRLRRKHGIQAQLEEIRAARAKELTSSLPNLPTSFRLTDDELHTISEMAMDETYCQSAVEDLHRRSIAPPPLPTVSQQTILIDEEKSISQAKNPTPYWATRIAKNRDRFVGTGLSKEDIAIGGPMYLLLNPRQAWQMDFLVVHLDANVLPSHDDDICEWDAAAHRTRFRFLPLTVLPAHKIPFGADDDIIVWRDLTFVGDKIQSFFLPLDFDIFSMLHPTCPPPSRRHAEKSKVEIPADARALMLLEFPWLRPSDLPGGKRHIPRKRIGKALMDKSLDEDTSEDDGGDAAGSDVAVSESEPDLTDIEEEMARIREEFHIDEEADSWFVVKPLIGHWTKEHKGVAHDANVGKASGGPPTKWCERYKFPRQKAL